MSEQYWKIGFGVLILAAIVLLINGKRLAHLIGFGLVEQQILKISIIFLFLLVLNLNWVKLMLLEFGQL